MSSDNTPILLDKAVHRVKYDCLADASITSVHNGQAFDQANTTAFGCNVSRVQLAIMISIATAAANACMLVAVPIYLLDLSGVGSDPFMLTLMFNLSNLCAFILVIVIRWCQTRELPVLRPKSRYLTAAIIGFCGSLHGILVSFGSLPNRTRRQLLGILLAAVLPNTVIWRYIILRKAVSVKRLLCAAIVLLGLFVSLIPDIFKLSSKDENDIRHVNADQHYPIDLQNRTSVANSTYIPIDSDVVYSWVWPLVVVGSTVPYALSLVITEREVKATEVSYLTLVFWTQVFNCLTLVAFFWIALIPNFGISEDINEFLKALQRGFYCSFSTDPSCHGSLVSAIIVIAASPCIDGFNFLLIKYAEGAIYTTLVMASSRPISALVWTMFIDTDLYGLSWKPRFNIHTILTCVGLLIVVPATILYGYFSHKEDMDNSKESTQRDRTL